MKARNGFAVLTIFATIVASLAIGQIAPDYDVYNECLMYLADQIIRLKIGERLSEGMYLLVEPESPRPTLIIRYALEKTQIKEDYAGSPEEIRRKLYQHIVFFEQFHIFTTLLGKWVLDGEEDWLALLPVHLTIDYLDNKAGEVQDSTKGQQRFLDLHKQHQFKPQPESEFLMITGQGSKRLVLQGSDGVKVIGHVYPTIIWNQVRAAFLLPMEDVEE